jgi:pimeloyl-ACP methyl ester carboxylesterase
MPRVKRLIFLVTFCSAAASAQSLRLADCRIESQTGAGSVSARCGRLQVPENRADPDSKKLQLHVAVVPSLRLKAAADPLFIISGGPGQAAGDMYISMSGAFARIRRDRDIVLVDQRGTGRSNRLDCPFPDDADLASVDSKLLEEAARTCLSSLRGDPRFYTTSVAVRDLEDVRAALGYSTVNIYGVSYGTRVAQHYMRRYPARVRAAILDGAVPVDLALGPDMAIQAQRALDALFERCEQDADCHSAFAGIRERFKALYTRLQDSPITVTLANPVDGTQTQTSFGAPQLGSAVRLLSYSDETASILPLLVYEAQALQQPQGLAAQYLMIKRSTETQIAYGMQFAVICSEDAPRWMAEGTPDAALAATYLGTAFMTGLQSICARWPRGQVDEDFGAPLVSKAPVLILSGANDPVTPQSYGARVLEHLPNGQHLILAGQGHGQLANGCMPRVAADFIRLGSTVQLQSGCVADVTAAPFMLSRTATAP